MSSLFSSKSKSASSSSTSIHKGNPTPATSEIYCEPLPGVEPKKHWSYDAEQLKQVNSHYGPPSSAKALTLQSQIDALRAVHSINPSFSSTDKPSSTLKPSSSPNQTHIILGKLVSLPTQDVILVICALQNGNSKTRRRGSRGLSSGGGNTNPS